MDIKRLLEKEHSKSATLAIVKYVGNDAMRFKELMGLLFGEDKKLSQRAAWAFSHVAIEQSHLLKLYFQKLLETLVAKDKHVAVGRNILRVFQEIDIPEKYESAILDHCFKIMISPAEAIANRAFAITTASKICLKYPELQRELLIVLDQLTALPQEPAIRVRIKSALKHIRSAKSKV